MKIKKILGLCALPALLMGSAIAFASSKPAKAEQADATNVGEITISEVRNAISNASAMYLLPTQNYDLPDSWDYPYVGVGEDDGVFINGVKNAGISLKYAGTGSAFITFYVGLPTPAVEGDVVEFKGEFSCAAADRSFTMNYTAQRFGETWVRGLEDYDTVSLADANLPDISNVAMNTDDMAGVDSSYVTDPAGLPKKKGFFGLTNSTGSYAFQFNYQKTETGTGWFHVLIGGQGPLWKAGHFIDFGFLDAWADTGHTQIKELQGNGNNWAADELYATGAIALGWNAGSQNLLEMGMIKIKDSAQYFVFFKVNNVLKYGEAWTLNAEAGGMTTKVTLQYAGTDATVSNSITPASTRLSPGTYVAGAKQFYLNMQNNACPAINNWDDYFMPVVPDNLKLNNDSVGYSNWNYFKKTGVQQMFLALGDIGITPVSGDVLYVGGMFKAAKEVNGVKVLFKVNFAETYFQFNGEAWRVVDPDYLASDFAKDLLKQTAPVCSAASDGNHDALASLWTTLSGAEYFGLLKIDQQEALKLAGADATIVVPTTSEGIDEMSASDAVAAAMYRYDYCSAKYNLSNFIDRTLTVSFGSSFLSAINNSSSNNIIVIIAVLSLASVSVIGVFMYKRKQRQ